ncbi:unnamed protein product [Caretta caretta]
MGLLMTGYVVCSQHDPVEAHSLPGAHSAQVTEIVALTRACTLAKDKSVTVYTSSRYTFRVVHDYRQLWKYRGFLTSGYGARISNGSLFNALLSALELPSALAIVKCVAHQNLYDDVTRGHALADATAR